MLQKCWCYTHSSHCRSWASLTRSLKQPREYMLSSTSGSSSVRDMIRPMLTRLGGGSSRHGSLRPALHHTQTNTHMNLSCLHKSSVILPVMKDASWNHFRTISEQYNLFLKCSHKHTHKMLSLKLCRLTTVIARTQIININSQYLLIPSMFLDGL